MKKVVNLMVMFAFVCAGLIACNSQEVVEDEMVAEEAVIETVETPAVDCTEECANTEEEPTVEEVAEEAEVTE